MKRLNVRRLGFGLDPRRRIPGMSWPSMKPSLAHGGDGVSLVLLAVVCPVMLRGLAWMILGFLVLVFPFSRSVHPLPSSNISEDSYCPR